MIRSSGRPVAPALGSGSPTFLLFGVSSFVVFLIITALVLFSNTAQGFDARLASAIYNASLGATLTQIMVLSSRYGEVFWVGVVAIMLLFGRRNAKHLAIELAVLFVVGIIADDVVKYLAYEPRPFDTVPGIIARIPEPRHSSFPSGHALIVSIGAVFALCKFRGGSWKAEAMSAILTIEAAIVSYGRVYLGVHYPLDVLAGVFLAGAIVFFGLFLSERYFGWLTQRGALLAEKLFSTTLRIPEIFSRKATA